MPGGTEEHWIVLPRSALERLEVDRVRETVSVTIWIVGVGCGAKLHDVDEQNVQRLMCFAAGDEELEFSV